MAKDKTDFVVPDLLNMIETALSNRLGAAYDKVEIIGRTGKSITFKLNDQGIGAGRSFLVKLKEK